MHFCELYSPDSMEGLECHLGAMEIEAMEEDLVKKKKIKKITSSSLFRVDMGSLEFFSCTLHSSAVLLSSLSWKFCKDSLW